MPSLSLFFDSDLSSPGLICCCAMSLRYVDMLCLATWFVAIFPAHRSPACSRCASYWGSLLPYGAQPSRWGHICGVKAAVVLDRNEGLVCFSFPFGLILRVGITLCVDTAFDLILDRNVVFSVSLLGWFRTFTVASPIRRSSWMWLLCPFAPVALFSVILPLSFMLRSPSGSSVLVSSHFYTTGGCHYYLALYPSGWASSLYLRLLFAPCHCRRVSWWSSLRPRVFGNSCLSPVFFPIR